MRKTLATLTLAAAALVATPADATDSHTHRDWAACEYEDGSSQRRCIWDGRHMGNGRGSSAKVINGGEDNARYVRISHKRAHHLIGCDK